ncbi:MAG TPA: FGGY-family carbohydrate kinase [Vicinamibacterales bacterium]|nr:FGGY-family carbohydrate kinase [Vicinamibacterales bacterium]
MSFFLGLDSSTQGLTAVIIAVSGTSRDVVWQHTINYDRDLPEYGTRHGVLQNTDPRVVRSSPAMWADALDRMMARIATERPIDKSRIAAISGAGQQHGSVYLSQDGLARLAAMDERAALASQMDGLFTRDASPIWMDSSTSAECEEIDAALGGPAVTARLTGSRACERFTGPQIRKLAKDHPGRYEATVRIHLVSSFLASLLAAVDAPIDPGDGAGMNLMDLASGEWSDAALDATAPGLRSKLPRLAPASTVIGHLGAYWTGRYGFSPATKVVTWTGDNPSSLIGTGLIREGRVAISLGTSDTIFGAMDAPRVSDAGIGHVFGSPTGGFMGITVFKNGSLARERIRDTYALDWDAFSLLLQTSPPGNHGALMLPWFDPEITPAATAPDVRRHDLDPHDAHANVRAVVEGQMMAMARHSAWMGVRVDTIHATGGASQNTEILQVMADVFGARVERFRISNSAALGAALRAYQSHTGAPWPEVVTGFVEPVAGGAVAPISAHVAVYDELKRKHAAFEKRALSS